MCMSALEAVTSGHDDTRVVKDGGKQGREMEVHVQRKGQKATHHPFKAAALNDRADVAIAIQQ